MTRKPPKKNGKAATSELSNAALLKLAARKRPPQEWYDDQTDPTKPAASGVVPTKIMKNIQDRLRRLLP